MISHDDTAGGGAAASAEAPPSPPHQPPSPSRPSNLCELEWADDQNGHGSISSLATKESSSRRPRPDRPATCIPGDVDLGYVPMGQEGPSRGQQQQQSRRSMQHRRRSSNGGGGGPPAHAFRRLSNAGSRASAAQSVASRRRDMYERAARETTGVAQSSASAASRGGGGASRDGSRGSRSTRASCRIGESVAIRRNSMASVGEDSVVGEQPPAEAIVIRRRSSLGSMGGFSDEGDDDDDEDLMNDVDVMNEIRSVVDWQDSDDSDDGAEETGGGGDADDGGRGDDDDDAGSRAGSRGALIGGDDDGGVGGGADDDDDGVAARVRRGGSLLGRRYLDHSRKHGARAAASAEEGEISDAPCDDSSSESLDDFNIVLAMRNALGYNRRSSVTDFADADDECAESDTSSDLGASLRKYHDANVAHLDRHGDGGGAAAFWREKFTRGRCCSTAPCFYASSQCLSTASRHKSIVFLAVGCVACLLAIAAVRAPNGDGGRYPPPPSSSPHAATATDGGSPFGHHGVVLPSYLEDNLADGDYYIVMQQQLAAEALASASEGDDAAAAGDESATSAATLSSSSSTSSSFDVPLFWTMPHSASDFMSEVFGRCYGLVQASGAADGDGLSAVELDGLRYVNVDVTTPEGLARAAALDLLGASGHGSSGVGVGDGGANGTATEEPRVNVVSTPLLHGAAAALFDPSHKGRLLTIFRHPVDRIAAEHRAFLRQVGLSGHGGLRGDPYSEPTGGGGGTEDNSDDLASVTLEEYSRMTVDNYVTRRLVLGDRIDPDRDLTEIELILAKEILRRKAAVGLYDDLPGAVRRFAAAFDSSRGSSSSSSSKTDYEIDMCVRDLAEKYSEGDGGGPEDYSDLILPGGGGDGGEEEEEDTATGGEGATEEEQRAAVAERNKFDVALYEFAEELYEYQAGWRRLRHRQRHRHERQRRQRARHSLRRRKAQGRRGSGR